MTIRELVLLFAKEADVFTIDEIAEAYFNSNVERRKLYNILSRLCKDNKLHRYKRGVYGYVFYSQLFQKSGFCSEEEALAKIYLRNNEGYISGADFYNIIGLSTWIPAKKSL